MFFSPGDQGQCRSKIKLAIHFQSFLPLHGTKRGDCEAEHMVGDEINLSAVPATTLSCLAMRGEPMNLKPELQ